MYEQIESPLGLCIRRIEDGAFIPSDEVNVDYQQYLKWLEETNGL